MSSTRLITFCADKGISDADWANTPDTVRRSYAWLVEEHARLQEQTQRSSRNSSLPPSKDKPQHTKPRRKHATGRTPGGQPGHRGVTRPLVPPEQVTTTHTVRPATCPCGHVFPDDAPTTGDPYRHQIFEIPPITPTITEYQLQHCACLECGAT